MPGAHARIDSLKVDIQVIGDMVLDLQAKVGGHDRRFDQVDARLAAHDARFDNIDAQLAEILSRLPQRGNGGTAN